MLKRWIKTGGSMGNCPDWFQYYEAAKWLGVPPWELMEREMCWTIWANIHKSVMSEYQH